MNHNDGAYVPALGYGFLTRLYDPVLALTTRDSVDGRLPQMLADGGFAQVRERGVVETLFGTLGLYSAKGLN